MLQQIERDVHDILTHKKDGEVVVRGSGPKIVKGKTEVIDDVRKGKAEIKASLTVRSTIKKLNIMCKNIYPTP